MFDIQEAFNKVIAYSQTGIPEPKTDKLFEMWRQNKANIIEAFGDKLIYEYPEKLTFEFPESEEQERIESFLDYCWGLGCSDLGGFVDAQRAGFFNNKVVEDFEVNGTKITKNSKLVKAFKHFIADKEKLDKIQNEASRIIQENKITGTLCFSVHPLDYLSVSENTYNWRSCHALDGEYRAGNLSYMMDSSTIVCYIKGDDEAQLPHFPSDVPWNTKKWRVLLYLSNNWKMAFAGKPYPFFLDGAMDKIIDILDDKFSNAAPWDDWYTRPTKEAHWSKWSNDFINTKIIQGIKFQLSDEYVPLGSELVPLHDLVKDHKGSKHFNDVLKSSCYKPVCSYLVDKASWSEYDYAFARPSTNFTIGEYTYCLRCGKEEVIDGCSTMMCYDCELHHGISENDNFGFCCECGARLEVDCSHYFDDEIYCDACYRSATKECDRCGDRYLESQLIYNERTDEYICNWCDREEEE